MAQSALTVTPPNPTPPTNMSCTGVTGPNPPNYSKTHYAEPFGAKDANGYFTDETPPGVRSNPNPPPWPATASAGSVTAFAANAAALAGGSAATAGGTEGTYPGTGGVNTMGLGAVPASTSAAHEGAGAEVVTTRAADFTGPILVTYPLATVGLSPTMTQAIRDAGPNASHASFLGGATVPTITVTTGVMPNNPVSGPGTIAITVTGTGFTRASVVYIDGIAQNTNYVSATSLTVANAPKRATAGTRSVTVVNGGGPTSAAFTWTFT